MHVPDAISANELRVYFRTLINNSFPREFRKKIGALRAGPIYFLKVPRRHSVVSVERGTNDDIDRGVLSGAFF